MDSLEKRFLDYLGTFEVNSIIQTSQLKNTFQDEFTKLIPFLQALINSNRVRVAKTKAGAYCYKIMPKETSKKLNGLSSRHCLVLQHITSTGGKGIWVRNLRRATGIMTSALNSILVELEKRELIKSITSIKNKKQRLYIGFDVTPDKEHTGGVWFNSEGDFDNVFVEQLTRWVLSAIRQHGTKSVKELVVQLRKSKISKISLKEEDISLVIDRLRLSGVIEEFIDPFQISKNNGKMMKKWTLVNQLGNTVNKLSNCVCLACPVKDQCTEGGVISPETCVYMDTLYGSDNLKF